jgi:hypothetical protein
MDPLYRQALLQGVVGLVFFVALIFGTAGTWDYWQGWVFLAVFAIATTAFTVYLAIYDKPLALGSWWSVGLLARVVSRGRSRIDIADW